MKKFKTIYHFISFYHISLGFHIDFSSPNIEIHLPFSFIKIGWTDTFEKNDIFEFSSFKKLNEHNKNLCLIQQIKL